MKSVKVPGSMPLLAHEQSPLRKQRCLFCDLQNNAVREKARFIQLTVFYRTVVNVYKL